MIWAMTTYRGADGTDLHSEEHGNGEVLVVLAGGAGRHPDYLGDLAGLAEDRRVIVPHLRSVGKSPVPDDQRYGSFWYQARDLDALRRELHLERISLVAHSAGTRLAIAYSAQFADHVNRMLLITPPADYLVDVLSDREEIRARRRGESLYDDALSLLLSSADADSDESLTAWQRATAPVGYAAWGDAQQEHARLGAWSYRAAADFGSVDPPPDLAMRLGGVAASVLVLAGSDDGLTGVAPVVALADLFPAGHASVIEAAGHYPWVDQPERFLSAAKTFLTESATR